MYKLSSWFLYKSLHDFVEFRGAFANIFFLSSSFLKLKHSGAAGRFGRDRE